MSELLTTHFSTNFEAFQAAGCTLMWTAHYRNPIRIIRQYESTGIPKSFAEIPRKNLKSVWIQEIVSGKVVAKQDFIPGMSPFYRLRRRQDQSPVPPVRVHILGWAVWDGKPTCGALHVSFIEEISQTVEMGHFIEGGRDPGLKYPIVLADYDYPPVVWT